MTGPDSTAGIARTAAGAAEATAVFATTKARWIGRAVGAVLSASTYVAPGAGAGIRAGVRIAVRGAIGLVSKATKPIGKLWNRTLGRTGIGKWAGNKTGNLGERMKQGFGEFERGMEDADRVITGGANNFMLEAGWTLAREGIKGGLWRNPLRAGRQALAEGYDKTAIASVVRGANKVGEATREAVDAFRYVGGRISGRIPKSARPMVKPARAKRTAKDTATRKAKPEPETKPASRPGTKPDDVPVTTKAKRSRWSRSTGPAKARHGAKRMAGLRRAGRIANRTTRTTGRATYMGIKGARILLKIAAAGLEPIAMAAGHGVQVGTTRFDNEPARVGSDTGELRKMARSMAMDGAEGVRTAGERVSKQYAEMVHKAREQARMSGRMRPRGQGR